VREEECVEELTVKADLIRTLKVYLAEAKERLQVRTQGVLICTQRYSMGTQRVLDECSKNELAFFNDRLH
jgi:hypothetical protein